MDSQENNNNINKQQVENLSDSIEIITEDDLTDIRQKEFFAQNGEEAESTNNISLPEEASKMEEQQKQFLTENNNINVKPEQENMKEDENTKKEESNGVFLKDEKTGDNLSMAICKEKESCYTGFARVEESLNHLFRGILKEKLQLHENMDNLQSAISDIFDIKEKEIQNLKQIIEQKDFEIEKYKEYTNKLREDVENLKMDLKNSEKHLDEALRNLEKYQKEHKELLSQLEKNEFSSIDSLSFTNRKLNSGDESQQHDGDKALEFHKEDIQIMDDFKALPWQNVHDFLLKDMDVEYKDLLDVLFFTFWEAYKFSKDSVLQQQKQLFFNLHFLHSPELPENNNFEQNINEKVQKNLRELMLDIEPKDLQRTFKEKLVKIWKFDDKILQCINNKIIFDDFIQDCLQICRVLCLKTNCLHLKSHALDKPVEREFFYSWGIKGGIVERVIYPALICFNNNKITCLRKGIVWTKS